jgi:imidazolonepropionase-like amidohydrolase
MKCYAKSLAAMAFALCLAGCGDTTASKDGDGKTTSAGGDTSYFYGARIIPGDGSPALEDQSFIVTNGKITKIGPRKEVEPPKGSNRVELTGRTVTPAFINLAAQPGMNNGNQYGPKNYTRDSVTADLSRYAYYGVVAVLTSGTDSGNLANSVSDEIRNGKIKGARLLTAGRGLAPKGGGPAGLGDVPYQIASAADAKRAVGELATDKAVAIKLWMDDGNGKGPKLKADAYTTAIEEAHKRNLKVVAEVTDLSDAKDLVKAGIDGFVSSIRDKEVDDALISSMKEKNVFLAPALTSAESKFVYADKPDWLGEQTMREVYPAQLMGYLLDNVSINKYKRLPDLGELRSQYATAVKNLKKLSAGGVKIALGTDSGAAATYPGYFELREMILMADAGMQPMDVIKAATSVPAAILGLNDLGTIAVGKTGDFLSMPNNPVEKMANVKDIGMLYMNGSEQERSALVQDIKINTEQLKITKADRERDAQAEFQAQKDAAVAKMKHYGKLAVGPKSQFVRGLAIPVPLDSKADAKPGPPDKVTLSVNASAADIRGFYAEALAAYKWNAAGNCWEKESPSRKLCLEAGKNSAVITITDK